MLSRMLLEAQDSLSPGDVPEEAGRRGGRKDVLLGVNTAPALLVRTPASLASVLVACLSLRKHSLLATGSGTRTRQLPTHPTCPPSFSVSTWQFHHLHSFFFFLSFSHAEIQPIHQSYPEAAQLL